MAFPLFKPAKHSRGRFEHDYGRFKIEFPAADESPTSQLLTKARDSADRGDLDSAWKYLNDAQRLQILTFCWLQLEDRRRLLVAEVASKVQGWRKDAIDSILASAPKDLSAQATPEQQEVARKALAKKLMECQEIFDDFSNTRYHKINLYQAQLRDLVWISVAAIALLLVLIGRTGTDPSTWGTWDWKRLMLVLLVGVLGACFSATTKIMNTASEDETAKSKIPDLVTRGWVTLARTVFGATPALAAYAFLQANILKLDNGSFAGIVVASFASGFSERFVLKLLQAVGSKDDPKSTPDAPPTPTNKDSTTAAPNIQAPVPATPPDPATGIANSNALNNQPAVE